MVAISQNKEASHVMTHDVTPESTCATLVSNDGLVFSGKAE